MDKTLVRASKLLSLVLRHEPQRIGITLDSAGWVGVDELLAAVHQAGIPLTRDLLQRVVRAPVFRQRRRSRARVDAKGDLHVTLPAVLEPPDR